MKEFLLEDKNYIKKSLMDFWGNLPLLLFGDIIFCIFCIPSLILFVSNLTFLAIILSGFTAIPAFTGLVYLTGRVGKGIKSGIRDIFFGISHFYGRSIVIGILIAFLNSVILGTLTLLKVNPDPFWFIFPLSIQLAALILLVNLLSYIFPLMTIYDLSLKVTFTHAFFLSSKYIMPTIGMLSMLVLFNLLIRWTKFGLIIICPILWAVFISNITLSFTHKQQSNQS